MVPRSGFARDSMQPRTKNITTIKAIKARRSTNPRHGWFETPWYYVSIAYRGKQMSLLVETDSEEEARREGEALCSDLGYLAKRISVTKVVIQ
jgi:hypothetical protein